MTNLPVLEEVKKTDERLYAEVLKNHPSFMKDEKKLKSFIQKADRLLDDLRELSNQVKSVEDYNWLSEAALKWQVIYSSILNIPKDIEIVTPAHQLESSLPSRPFTDEELRKWLEQRAYILSVNRRVNILLREANALRKKTMSHPAEINWDWHQAEVEFAGQVVDGEIDFVRQISAKSYPQFERIWLREVKQFKAYHKWEMELDERGDEWNPARAEEDYYTICDAICGMLVNEKIKKPAKDFAEVKNYLEIQYLNSDGLIDEAAHDGARAIIQNKAQEISASSGGQDELANWGMAKTYVKLFYENIIPAVMDNDFEKSLLALKAFQYNALLGEHSRIINCFEVLLAIYFLNPAHIEEMWNNSEGEPPASALLTSTVSITSWPKSFVIPKDCRSALRFDPQSHELIFEGVMTPAQKADLLRAIAQPEHGEAIERLYKRSRSLPRWMTI